MKTNSVVIIAQRPNSASGEVTSETMAMFMFGEGLEFKAACELLENNQQVYALTAPTYEEILEQPLPKHLERWLHTVVQRPGEEKQTRLPGAVMIPNNGEKGSAIQLLLVEFVCRAAPETELIAILDGPTFF